MASNQDGQVDLGVGLDIADSVATLDKLVSSLGKALAGADDLQKRLNLKTTIDQGGLDQLQATILKTQQAFNKNGAKGFIDELRKAGVGDADTRAATVTNQYAKQQIDRVNANLDNVVTKVLDHFAGTVERKMRTSFESIEARLTQSLTKQLTQTGLYSGRSANSIDAEVQTNITLGERQRLKRAKDAATVNDLFALDDQAVQTRSIRAQPAQVGATLDIAANNASKKLIAAQEEVLKASLTKAGLNASQISSIYNDPAVVSALGNLFNEKVDRIIQRGAPTAIDSRSQASRVSAANAQARAELIAPQSDADLLATARAKVAPKEAAAPKQPYGFQDRLGTLGQYAFIYQAFQAATGTISAVVELEKELKAFQAITATTDTEMAVFEKRFLSIASTSKFSATEVAKAATIMGQAGFSAKQVGDSLEAVVQLATASGSTLQSSVDVLTSVLSVFNLQSTDATRVANVMTASLNLTKLTIDKLAQGIQYSGNIAKDAGLDFVELTSILGALSNAGIRSGSTLGTGTRQILTELLNPSKKFQEVLQTLGISLADIDVKTHGVVGVLENLKAGGFGTADAMKSFELRAVAAFSALSNNIDTVKAMEAQLLLTNAAVEANNKQMESLGNTWSKFFSSVTTTVFSGSGPILKFFQSFLNLTSNLIGALAGIPAVTTPVITVFTLLAGVQLLNWVGGLFDRFTGISLLIPKVGAAFTGLFRIVSGFTSIAGIFAGLEEALAVILANPLTAIIVGLGAAFAAFHVFGGDKTAEQLDKIGAAANDTKEKVDSTRQTISALSDTILKLSERTQSLTKDPDLLRNAVLEAEQQFGKFGITLEGNIDTVEKLMLAHRALRDELTRGLPLQIQGQIDTARDKQKTLKAELPSVGTSGLAKLQGIFGSVQTGENVSGANTFAAQANNLLGDVGTSAVDAILSPQTKKLQDVNLIIATLIKSQRDFQSEIDKGGDINVADLNAKITAIRGLLQALNFVQGKLSNITANDINVKDLVQQQSVADVKALPSFIDFQHTIDDFKNVQIEGLNKILKDGFKTKAGFSAFNAFQGDLDISGTARIASIMTAAQEEIRKGADPDAIKKATDDFIGQIKGIQNTPLAALGEAGKKIRQDADKVLKGEKNDLNTQLATLTKKESKAKTLEDLEDYQKKIQEVLQKIRDNEISQAYVEAGGHNETGDSLAASKTGAVDEKKTQAADKAQQVQEKLIADMFDAITDTLNTQIKNIDKVIAQKRNEIKDGKLTGPDAETKLQEINELISQKLDKQWFLGSYAVSKNPTNASIEANAAKGQGNTADATKLTQDAYNDVNKNIDSEIAKIIKSQGLDVTTALTQSRRSSSLIITESILPSIDESFDRLLASESAKINAQIDNALKSNQNPKQYEEKLAELQSDIATKKQNTISQVLALRDSRAAAEAKLPVTNAELQLGQLQRANSVGNADDLRVAFAQRAVDDAKRTEAAAGVTNAERALADATARRIELEKTSAANSNELNIAKDRETTSSQKLQEATDKLASTMVAASSTAAQVAKSGVVSFFAQNNVTDKYGNFQQGDIQLAKDVNSELNSGLNAGATAFTNWATKAKSAKDAFKDFSISVLSDAATLFAKKGLANLMFAAFSAFGGGTPGSNPNSPTFATPPGNWQGGMIRRALGGAIPTRDSVHMLAAPGEYMLRQSAVNAIGRDNLDQLNNLGNSTRTNPGPRAIPKERKPDQVNVWVTHPENVPPPGPKDILAVVTSDIIQRGPLKTLIKSVAVGAI